MQNNVTYLSRKLQRSLDNNYNVIDMPAVIEIISTLEKTSVTKELLETTRLGKYINELRRKTSNESLAKRAKELLKKWRDLILPDANGQIRSTSANSSEPHSETKTKKRPASSTPPNTTTTTTTTAKKLNLNGSQPRGSEYDFSDNSNCSMTLPTKDFKKTDVIFINSDSNSSMPESGDHFDASNDASTTENIPKKRGRKKGSKNHKNLVIAAEESFTNKMAVSRNSKVKTTQELLADIQNRKPSSQDIELRTAQLTESLTRIEHKLNPQKVKTKPVINDDNIVDLEPKTEDEDDEIVDVVGNDPPLEQQIIKDEIVTPEIPLFTIENLLKQLPNVDKSCLEEPDDDMPICDCPTPPIEQQQQQVSVEIVSNITKDVFHVNDTIPAESQMKLDENNDDERTSNISGGDCVCAAKLYLNDKYHLDTVGDCQVAALHDNHIPNVNGNYGKCPPVNNNKNSNVIVENIVPNFMSERLHKKRPNENFQKYSISIHDCHDVNDPTKQNICDSDSNNSNSNNEHDQFRTSELCENIIKNAEHTNSSNDLNEFREWHETLDVISYNDELLRILPYVIID